MRVCWLAAGAVVRFYLGTTLVKRHARVAPGKGSTDVVDFPPHKSGYALGNVDGVRHVSARHRATGVPVCWTSPGGARTSKSSRYNPTRSWSPSAA